MGQGGESHGTWAGRYEIQHLLGAGERKQVYRASDLRLGREVAIAIIAPEEPGDDGLTTTEWEARIMALVGSHPHIVTVYDFGEEAGQPYMVSQYMPGGDVRALCRKAAADGITIPITRAARLASEVC